MLILYSAEEAVVNDKDRYCWLFTLPCTLIYGAGFKRQTLASGRSESSMFILKRVKMCSEAVVLIVRAEAQTMKITH